MLGIGVVTCRRPDALRECLAAVRENTVSPHRLAVAADGDDTSVPPDISLVRGDRRGLGWNRNRLLYLLGERLGCDPVVILEDDTHPAEVGWERSWVEAAALWGAVTYAQEPGANGAGAGTPADPYFWDHCGTQCVAVSRRSLRRVGYSDTRFAPPYGSEDTEWRWRLAADAGHHRDHATPGLRSGVVIRDYGTFRDEALVEQNTALLYAIWGRQEQYWRWPWRTAAERVAFLAEQAAASVAPSPVPPTIYLLPGSSIAGGIRVVFEHASRLRARGHWCEVWGVGGPPSWFAGDHGWRGFPHTDDIGRALRRGAGGRRNLVATWWQTADWVATNLGPDDRGYYLVQDDDPVTYSGRPAEAVRVYGLGLTHITEAAWGERMLRERYGRHSVNVGIGVERDLYHEIPLARDRKRLLGQGRPHHDHLKGGSILAAAAKTVCQGVAGASLVTFGPRAWGPVAGIPHAHVSMPDDAKVRELYSQAGAFFLSSRHEGFGLPALEAMACGCPVVATRCGGPEEFCIDGETALTVPADDPAAAAAAVRRLFADRDLWDRLRTAGLKTAERYDWDGVIDRLEAVCL